MSLFEDLEIPSLTHGERFRCGEGNIGKGLRAVWTYRTGDGLGGSVGAVGKEEWASDGRSGVERMGLNGEGMRWRVVEDELIGGLPGSSQLKNVSIQEEYPIGVQMIAVLLSSSIFAWLQGMQDAHRNFGARCPRTRRVATHLARSQSFSRLPTPTSLLAGPRQPLTQRGRASTTPLRSFELLNSHRGKLGH